MKQASELRALAVRVRTQVSVGKENDGLTAANEVRAHGRLTSLCVSRF